MTKFKNEKECIRFVEDCIPCNYEYKDEQKELIIHHARVRGWLEKSALEEAEESVSNIIERGWNNITMDAFMDVVTKYRRAYKEMEDE